MKVSPDIGYLDTSVGARHVGLTGRAAGERGGEGDVRLSGHRYLPRYCMKQRPVAFMAL